MTDDVCVVAGGWSASRVDLSRLPGTVIGVNDAAVYLPRVDAVVSMDRMWTQNRWREIAAMRGAVAWLRVDVFKGEMRPMLDDLPAHVRTFTCDYRTVRFAEAGDPVTLNGTNSGSCALNLAYQMRPRRLWLLGFDGRYGPNGERHWYPEYPWSTKKSSGNATLSKWAQEYRDVAGAFKRIGTRVVNVSEWSVVDAFERMSPERFYEEAGT